MTPKAMVDYERTMSCFSEKVDKDLMESGSSLVKQARITQTCAVLMHQFSRGLKPDQLRQQVQSELVSLRQEGVSEKDALPKPLYERVLSALSERG